MNTKDTYTVTPDWMLDLPLDLWETIIYAVIWGFSMDGETVFHGSRAFLAHKAKCSTDKVDKSTKRLVELGLIEKRDKFVNGIKFCEYFAVTAGSRSERLVAAVSGGVAVPSERGSRCERHNNKDNIGKDKYFPNSDTIASSRAFDFKKSLIELGISEQTASDWMAVRKNAKATNSQTAFNALRNQIEKICKRHGVTAEQVAAFAVGKDWKGINAEWDAVKNIKNAVDSTNNDADADEDEYPF